jgi:tetratricopeptide (TPR) repeat protein
LDIDDDLPSLYNYRGVAQHNAQLVDESAESFLLAATENPHDTRSWINLGEARLHQFKLSEAISAFEEAYKHGDVSASIPRLLRAKGWADSWEQFEEIVHTAERIAMTCVSAVLYNRVYSIS